MTNILKYTAAFILTFSLISCQQDTQQEETQPQNQQPQSQQPFQGQMQPSAPDVDVSDKELEVFTDAIVAAQEIQMEAQREMIAIIEDEGLDVETYNQIAQATQMGQPPQQAGASEEDIQKFKSVSEDIGKAQQNVQQKMTRAIEDEGMEMERFQRINQAIQQDPELQKKVRQKMMESQMQQSPDNQGNGN